MFTKTKLLFTLFVLALTLSATPVLANTFDTVNEGFRKTVDNAGFPTSDGQNGGPQEIDSVAVRYINTSLGFVGLLFMLLILYGGYTWMMARGNEEQVKKGKTLMIQATVGLLIVLSARIITELVFDYFNSESI